MWFGAKWAYIKTLGGTVFQFASGVALARILDPADFGLFAAASVFTLLLSTAARLGLPAAAMQAREITIKEINTVFWVTQLSFIVALVILFFLSGLLIPIYEDDRFRSVLLLMGVSFVFLPYASMGMAQLQREMRFDIVAKIQLVATLTGIISSITAALEGWGVYSLIIAGLVDVVTNTILIYVVTRWVPGLSFKFRSIAQLLRFGLYTCASTFLRVATLRIDRAFIGSILGTAPLGLYVRASSLAQLPADTLVGNLRNVLLTGFSRIQENPEETRILTRKAIGLSGLVVFPIAAILGIVAEDLIIAVYGSKWSGASDALRIMCLAIIPLVVGQVLTPIVMAQNLVGKLLFRDGLLLGLTVLLVMLTAPIGLVAVATAIVAREFIAFFFFHRLLSKSVIKLRLRSTTYSLLPAGVVVAFVISSGYVLQTLLTATGIGDAWMRLIILLPTMGCSILIGLLALKIMLPGHEVIVELSARISMLTKALRRTDT